jgi:hypothetical protein
MKDDIEKLADYLQTTMVAEIEADTFGGVMVVMLHDDGSIKRLPMPHDVGRMLQSGQGKDALFTVVRAFVKLMEAKGVAIGTDAWMGLPTEKALAMDKKEYDRIMEQNIGVPELERRGLAVKVEGLMCNVQTATEFLMRVVPYERTKHGTVWKPAQDQRGPTENFSGRMMMFN